MNGEHEEPQAGQGSGPEVGSLSEEAAKLLGALSGWASDVAHGVEGHFATGAPECTVCPVCRTVHAVRELSPEVKTQLAGAATSLLGAAATLLAAAVPDQGAREGSGVEHIDLDDDPSPSEEDPR